MKLRGNDVAHSNQIGDNSCNCPLARTGWTNDHQNFVEGNIWREKVTKPFLQAVDAARVIRPQLFEELQPLYRLWKVRVVSAFDTVECEKVSGWRKKVICPVV